MNPSPNRSSKSPKSTSTRKDQPGELAVNPSQDQVSLPETPDESSVPSALATPVDENQPPTPTDAPASQDKLQRPLYSSAPKEKAKPTDAPSDAPAISKPAAPSASLKNTPAVVVAPPAPVTADSAAQESAATDDIPAVMRQHPIPPPSEPRQYRAVGLVRGRYTQSEEHFTRGMLIAADGTAIDAVLLGRVMSLVKNHLDLEQEHLWVVYPRTRQEDGNLHAQIMGVWEPETLKKPSEPSSDEENQDIEVIEGISDSEASTTPLLPSEPDVEDGYFSIRGEVIYQSQDQEKYVIVKIKQAPRKNDENKMKFFKLKLKGDLATKAIGFFWDFHVKLEADSLMIKQANNIGALPIKKRKFPPGEKPAGFRGGGNKRPYTPRPTGDGPRSERPNIKPSAGAPPVPKEPLPKPVKKPKPVEQ
ncbi:hypothetical protein [Tychonema sp. BBK16]|uniref:hypothetical protein n=1 Tax=Tychonema sp. BBK16 TaxID=2699888 RepID=UPI001F1D829C|nr:hypothetical protein [Tychonema sp. BBK16]MCF6371577.1 hypothetical protein [Tychonema sp. BBK16]